MPNHAETAGSTFRRRRLLPMLGLALAAWSMGERAEAQFLRLGPLDFMSKLTTELIYTTNVEQERKSEAKGEMEDFYIIVSLDLVSDAAIAPSTQLKLDTGMSVEKHLNRSDLDNSTNPFGRANIETLTEISRYTLALQAGWERTSESSEDTAFPGSSRLTRREQEKYGYNAELMWETDPLRLSANYDFKAERYIAEEDQINDKDTVGYLFESNYRITRRVQAVYSYKGSRDELVNVPDDEPVWEITQRILLNFTLTEKPKFTYGWGYEKEDVGDDKGDWEMIHTFNLSDDFQLNPRVKGFYAISYEIEEVAEENDVAFTYGGGVEHEISSSAKQTLSAKKEPVDTFGSTTDTDSTTITYDFKKMDLIMYNLTFGFNVSYQIDEPLSAGPTEKIWTYNTSLAHEVALSTRLTRRLEYLYTREDSNLEEELLEEHRVTLSFTYSF